MASLGKFGQKFFAPPNICLLLHLCILRNVIVLWDMLHSTKSQIFHVLFFHYWQNAFAGQIWFAGCSLETHVLAHRGNHIADKQTYHTGRISFLIKW